MKFLTLAIIPLLAMTAFASPRLPEETPQQTFASAAEATEMLFQAVKSGDKERIGKILGGPTDLLSTDDEVQDDLDRGLFIQKYQEMHRIDLERHVLYVRFPVMMLPAVVMTVIFTGNAPAGSPRRSIGAENWPFPIPLVAQDGSWRFDAAKGRDEILFRQIGENELTAIATCLEFVAAERQHQGTPDTLNLEGSSPTSLVAKAASGSGGGDPLFLHGYYFRLLPGRKPVNGFTLIAYPAQYRSSGVMTFVVNQNGVVYEKDLGPNTSAVATSMIAFHKDSTWRAAEE